MNKEEVLQALEDQDVLHHEGSGGYYELLGVIQVKYDSNNWVDMLEYRDMESTVRYVRHLNNFSNFQLG